MSLKILRVIAYLQLFGGFTCLVIGLWLGKGLGRRLLKEELTDRKGLKRLKSYVWTSCLVSFFLFYGIVALKEWARILLIFFCFFGILNLKSFFSPGIFSFVLPFIAVNTRKYVIVGKTAFFLSIDIYLIYFFSSIQVKELFMFGKTLF